MTRTLPQLLAELEAAKTEEVIFEQRAGSITMPVADEVSRAPFFARSEKQQIAVSSEEAKVLREAGAYERFPGGSGHLRRRDEISFPEGSFVSFDDEKKPIGFIQIFPNGTAGYWSERGDRAQEARDRWEAHSRLFVARAAARP